MVLKCGPHWGRTQAMRSTGSLVFNWEVRGDGTRRGVQASVGDFCVDMSVKLTHLGAGPPPYLRPVHIAEFVSVLQLRHAQRQRASQHDWQNAHTAVHLAARNELQGKSAFPVHGPGTCCCTATHSSASVAFFSMPCTSQHFGERKSSCCSPHNLNSLPFIGGSADAVGTQQRQRGQKGCRLQPAPPGADLSR